MTDTPPLIVKIALAAFAGFAGLAAASKGAAAPPADPPADASPAAAAIPDQHGPRFVDVSEQVGLSADAIGQTVARLCFADLDNDGWPDVILDRHRVFMNRPAGDAVDALGSGGHRRSFAELPRESSGLPEPLKGSIVVFADMDGDGFLDAVIAESVESPGDPEKDPGRRTRWLPGRGDGTFGEARPIDAAPPRTTAAIAVGDVNRDGRLDLYLANWYADYGESYAGWPNDLVVQEASNEQRAGGNQAEPVAFRRVAMPDDDLPFDEETDAGGRPTYGAMIADLLPEHPGPELLELNYGRRWNRLWARAVDADSAQEGVNWNDLAPQLALDGDDVRHGRYPDWLKERAKEDSRFDRPDEPPFRANGNTFDCSVGDVDGDGDFDLFIAEIAHGWAGESSDRSRFLIQQRSKEHGGADAEATDVAETIESDATFTSPPRLSVDRIPEGVNNWNHGDLFCALADLDHDTRLDLVLSSGDYPDNQRLRIFMQQPDGLFEDRTEAIGVDHDGSQQISLADFDGDGDLDLIAGQTFFRYSKEQRAGRTPRPRLFSNELTEGRRSIVLRLHGDGEHVSTNALGAKARVTLPDGRTLVRQLTGIGGHAGKQHDFIIHIGFGEFGHADRVEIIWPDHDSTVQTFDDVAAGHYRLDFGGELVEWKPTSPSTSRSANDATGDSEQDPAQQGYLGLSFRDIPSGHTVVSWVLPGPLAGEGLASGPDFDLCRPDLVVAVDGEPMNAEAFADYIRDLGPGQSVAIETRRSNRRGGTIPSAPDHEDETRTVTVTTASRDQWIGSVGRSSSADANLVAAAPSSRPSVSNDASGASIDRLLDIAPGSSDSILADAIDEHELRGPLDTLLRVFASWPGKSPDPARLQRIRDLFADPFSLPERSIELTADLDPISLRSDPAGVAIALFARGLELGDSALAPTSPLAVENNDDAHDLAALKRIVTAAGRDLDRALADTRLPNGVPQAVAFLEVPHTTFYIGGPDAKSHIDVIRHSMKLDMPALMRSMSTLAQLANWSDASIDELRAGEPRDLSIDLPSDLREAVTGQVFLAEELGDGIGWLVVGGDGDNTYDMSKIAVVIDPGGDDVYSLSEPRAGIRAIIDVAGDDRYDGCQDQGVASAIDGVTLIDDRTGDDRHTGRLLSAGAAMRGAALLIDRAGADVYEGALWSHGAACYGAAGLIDLDNQNDAYLGDFLCQGAGGPRGVGAVIDMGGRDLYRANGPTSSAYGTPAVYQSFSQGMGFGYRSYASGGIGLLCDLAGDDRYEAGEFAQGGAYYYALGVLHDQAGRDLYYGNRYGQGFGVHQAFGALIDDAGDDTYWSMTAASQGAAWDIGAGLLLDRAGDDSYQCDGLGQGGAAQQAIAILLDLGGDDRYVAGRSATQGMSGDNQYHHHETGAYSFSLLLDRGGGRDLFSGDGTNGATLAFGSANENDPGRSRLHGLFIDR